MQEKGVFRGKVLELEKRIWNGIYKQTWGDQTEVSKWCKTCEEIIWKLIREIIEYKKINSTIQLYLNEVQNLKTVDTLIGNGNMTSVFLRISGTAQFWRMQPE